jgi:hypothetical protein
MNAKIAAFVLICAVVPGCGACGGNSTPESNRPPPCVAAWCSDVRAACDAWFRACPGLDGDAGSGAEATCTDGLGGLITQQNPGSEAEVSEAVAKCMQAAKTCSDAMACRERAAHPDGEDDEINADGAVVEVGLTETAVPPGTVMLPGDDPSCVFCAFSRCASESQFCFVDSAATPGCWADPAAYPPVVDCCVDYRQCMASCLGLDPAAGATYSLCTGQCDVDYPKGRGQFESYRSCMRVSCPTCGGSDAGS